MSIYHKWLGKNGSHKLTAHIRSGICTYRVKKMEPSFQRIIIRCSLFLKNLVTIFWTKHQRSSKWKSVLVYLQSSSSGFVTYDNQICHNIHVDLLSSSCLFVASVIQICHDIPSDLLNLCVYLSIVSFRFFTIFKWIGKKMLMKKIQICHNIHLWKSAQEYKLV